MNLLVSKYEELEYNLHAVRRKINNFEAKQLSFKNKQFINYIKNQIEYICLIKESIKKYIFEKNSANIDYLVSEIEGAVKSILLYQRMIGNRG